MGMGKHIWELDYVTFGETMKVRKDQDTAPGLQVTQFLTYELDYDVGRRLHLQLHNHVHQAVHLELLPALLHGQGLPGGRIYRHVHLGRLQRAPDITIPLRLHANRILLGLEHPRHMHQPTSHLRRGQYLERDNRLHDSAVAHLDAASNAHPID